SIQSLSDLENLRSAPKLTINQNKQLLSELHLVMAEAAWFTLGVMAPSAEQALSVLRKIEESFAWAPMQLVENPQNKGPVYLKANQNTGKIRIRIEHGLGKGVLISSHQSTPGGAVKTWGPLPLELFSS
ncbi:MAG: DUF1824 family protein, partial [Prochlorococcus sp.]